MDRRGPARASSLAQNCSGKHAAMLATCVANGWDLATYRDPAHPLQRPIAETLRRARRRAGRRDRRRRLRRARSWPISLTGLARAFGRLATAPAGTARPGSPTAIRAHPEWLGGTRRDVTALIRGRPRR